MTRMSSSAYDGRREEPPYRTGDDDLRDALEEVERLRAAAELAIKIIDTNLYHQREKVADAASVLRAALARE